MADPPLGFLRIAANGHPPIKLRLDQSTSFRHFLQPSQVLQFSSDHQNVAWLKHPESKNRKMTYSQQKGNRCLPARIYAALRL